MKLSVIIATRNRAAHLTSCLDSIVTAFANAAPIDGEIVVVDNGSTDKTAAIVQAWARASSVPLQLLSEPITGVSRAHNRGVRAARGDLLAFTDDDCRLSKDYVTDLLRHDAVDDGPVLRGGRVELGDPTDLPLTIKTGATRKQWSRLTNSAMSENVADSLAGCNLTMRRSTYEQLGPFDERFGPGSIIGSGADVEYVYRAYLANITIEHVPDMMVFHHHGRKTASTGYKLMRGYMIGNGALCAKYLFDLPVLCSPFYWDIKNAFKELLSGTNSFLPAIGFSHRDKVKWRVFGAMKYFLFAPSTSIRASHTPRPQLTPAAQ